MLRVTVRCQRTVRRLVVGNSLSIRGFKVLNRVARVRRRKHRRDRLGLVRRSTISLSTLARWRCRTSLAGPRSLQYGVLDSANLPLSHDSLVVQLLWKEHGLVDGDCATRSFPLVVSGCVAEDGLVDVELLFFVGVHHGQVVPLGRTLLRAENWLEFRQKLSLSLNPQLLRHYVEWVERSVSFAVFGDLER